MTYPDGWALDYTYDDAGATTIVKNGARTLETVAYDDLGRTTSITYDNGATRSHAYDSAARLTSITHNLSSAILDFAYNPAGQITARGADNSAYLWTDYLDVDITSIINALNQPTSVGGATVTHDSPRAKARTL